MRALFGPRERPLARGRATLLILRPRTRGSSDGNEGGQGDSGRISGGMVCRERFSSAALKGMLVK